MGKAGRWERRPAAAGSWWQQSQACTASKHCLPACCGKQAEGARPAHTDVTCPPPLQTTPVQRQVGTVGSDPHPEMLLACAYSSQLDVAFRSLVRVASAEYMAAGGA